MSYIDTVLDAVVWYKVNVGIGRAWLLGDLIIAVSGITSGMIQHSILSGVGTAVIASIPFAFFGWVITKFKLPEREGLQMSKYDVIKMQMHAKLNGKKV